MKTGVIGTGIMGQNHARIYSEFSELEAVYDINYSVAKKIAKKFKIEPLKDFKEMFSKGIEAVSIATPTHTHKKIALDCINNGIHVLIEKPMSMSIKDCEDIISAAKRNNVTLAIGHIERHNPVIQFIKKLLNKRKLGRIISITAKRVSSFQPRISDIGVIYDLAIHDIDIARFLSASEINTVYTMGGGINVKNREDYANIFLSTVNKTSISLEVNWLTPMKIRHLSLTCSNSYIDIDYINQSLTFSSARIIDLDIADLYQTSIEHNVRHIALHKEEPLKREIKDFIESIEKRKAPLVTGQDGLECVRVCNAALISLKTNRIISL